MPLDVVDANPYNACPSGSGGTAGGSTGGALFFIFLAYCGIKNKDKIKQKVQGIGGGSGTGITHRPGGTHYGGGQDMKGENMNITESTEEIKDLLTGEPIKRPVSSIWIKAYWTD